MKDEIFSELKKAAQATAHYYGDTVRRLFLAGALVMLVTLPFFNSLISMPLFLSILAIVILGIFAGFTSPQKRWVAAFNAAISVIALFVFEYYAVVDYAQYSLTHALFWVNQILAFIFFFALYYSAKTFRAMFTPD